MARKVVKGAELLVYLRNIQNKTQQQIAESTGIKQPMLSEIERGKHETIRLPTLEKLMKELHFTADEYLFGREVEI